MSVTLAFSLDELELDDLITDGYTKLLLYVSNTPDGTFTNTSVEANQTLAVANTAGAPHDFTFSYAGGNAAQWFKVIAWDGSSTYSNVNDSDTFHGGGGTTLLRVRQLVGKQLRCMKIGTTSSAGAGDGTTAIVNTAEFLRFPDDFFGGKPNAGGWLFHNVDSGEWTEVSDWDQSTGTFTFSPALSAQVGSGVDFELTHRWTPDELKEYINKAINMAYPKLSKSIIDRSLLTVDDQYEYPIPSNIRDISRLEIETLANSSSTSQLTRGQPWKEMPYELLYNGMDRSIQFKRNLDDDRRMRIHGSMLLEQLSGDTSYVEVTEPDVYYLVYLACHFAWAALVNDNATTDVSRYKEQATYNMTLAREFGDSMRTRRKPGRMWSRESQWDHSF